MQGFSPLHTASCFGKLGTVKMLVRAGAGVRVADNTGATCLTLAADFGHTETVRYLVGLTDVEVNHEGNEAFTALHFAVQEGHHDVVEVLIDAGADIDAKINGGRTPLHVACLYRKLAIVKVLVKAGADVCVTTNEGTTCLMLASNYGHTETVRYLVGLPEVDVHAANNHSWTPLHHAVKRNNGSHPDVIQVLIDAGADIEAKSGNGRSPLLLACEVGKLDALKILVEAGAAVCATDSQGDTCLILATSFGHTEIVRYLVGLKEVDVNYQGRNNDTALHNAVDDGLRDVVEVLIDAGADIEAKDEQGCSPLLLACVLGKLDAVKMLVDAGAAVCATESEGHTCLMSAAHFGHTEIVRYLVGLPEVDVNYQGWKNNTALHNALQTAVDAGLRDVVEVLIDAGADIEAKDEQGRSPLLLACVLGKLDAVKMLVDAGAAVCATDRRGYTCLILAAYYRHTEVVRYLVGLPEVDVHAANNHSRTPLHHAVTRNYESHPDVVQVLIDAGADIEAKNEKGRSPLLLACQVGQLDAVKMLVEAGADVCATDSGRYTCLILAAYYGHTEIVRYLVGLPDVDVNHTGNGDRTALHYASSNKHTDVVRVLLEPGAVCSTAQLR